MPKQKFHRGNVVHISNKLGASMSHFEADQDVVIVGSYCDQYHDHGDNQKTWCRLEQSGALKAEPPYDPSYQPNNCAEQSGGHSYSVLFEDGHEVSWYYERQLVLVRVGDESEIERVEKRRASRELAQTTLEWIVAHWSEIRLKPPGSVANFLMGLSGISEPWGSQGEGMAYMANWRQTFALIDPVLSKGSLGIAREFFKSVKPLTPIDVRLR